MHSHKAGLAGARRLRRASDPTAPAARRTHRLHPTEGGLELLAAALDVGLPEAVARASLARGLRAGARKPRRRRGG
jgi:hypothetical protein